MEQRLLLSILQPMQQAEICCVGAEGSLRRRLDDLGVIEGTRVQCLRVCPLGDPKLYLLRGTALALRNSDASRIEVRLLPDGGGETG